MIYQLPTRGAVRYRGEHPQNLRSVSSGDAVHLETQNGLRYVGLAREFTDLPRYGQGITNFIRSGRLEPVVITSKMYTDLVAAAVARNQGVDKGAVRALLAKWDLVFSAVLS